MKKIDSYEFKDLSLEVQEIVKSRELEVEVEFQLDALGNALQSGEIDEEGYYATLGCSKGYAESTAWFVPSCYYEENQELVDRNVAEQVKQGLYTKSGAWIQPIKE